jgi:hypothetical protein
MERILADMERILESTRCSGPNEGLADERTRNYHHHRQPHQTREIGEWLPNDDPERYQHQLSIKVKQGDAVKYQSLYSNNLSKSVVIFSLCIDEDGIATHVSSSNGAKFRWPDGVFNTYSEALAAFFRCFTSKTSFSECGGAPTTIDDIDWTYIHCWLLHGRTHIPNHCLYDCTIANQKKNRNRNKNVF